jgi:nucleotide-binding universal stress UspA family protein
MSSATDTRTPSIVVGVDGSESSVRAVRWAAEQAQLTKATITAVIAWQTPPGAGFGNMLAMRDAADTVVDDVVNKAAYPDVLVTKKYQQGSPAAVLIEASKDADLLVVGTRGHGGFAGMLLGSVSAQCVHHAPCPVVVVRPPLALTSEVADVVAALDAVRAAAG